MATARRGFKLDTEFDGDILEFLEKDKRYSGSYSATCRKALRVYMKYKEIYGDFPFLPSDTLQKQDTPSRQNMTTPEPVKKTVEPVKQEAPKPTPLKQDELLLGGQSNNDDEVKNKLLNGFQGF